MSFTQDWAAADRERWELDARPADVLIISSQLAFGTVGLSASEPVARQGGLRCATVPTAILSNLPHYPAVHAFGPDPEWLVGALHDLGGLGVVDEIATVHTGYFASAAQVEAVAGWLAEAVRARPDLRVVVDPTFGDHDVGLYTAPDVAAALRDRLIPLATGLTPNGFEFETLTGLDDAARDFTDEERAAKARSLVGDRGEWIVVTGAADPSADEPRSSNLVVTRSDWSVVTHERVEVATKGTGDVFTSEIIVALHGGASIEQAVRAAGDVVAARLARRVL